MTIGLNANNDGSGSVQTGGSDAIQISATQNVTIPNNQTVVGQIRSNATSTPPTFADSAGTQIGTLCRAWVNFNGTLTNPITPRASFNVSSVTKNGTGDYTINFTNAMTDTNYGITGWCRYPSTATGRGLLSALNNMTYSTSAVQVRQCESNTGAAQDGDIVCISVFR